MTREWAEVWGSYFIPRLSLGTSNVPARSGRGVDHQFRAIVPAMDIRVPSADSLIITPAFTPRTIPLCHFGYSSPFNVALHMATPRDDAQPVAMTCTASASN
jgi:hypothetical protein